MHCLHYYCEARESSTLRNRAITYIACTPTCTDMFSYHIIQLCWLSKGKTRERETSLTISRNDPQGHRVSSLFDQVDDIRVGFIGDGASVYSQDPVSNFQFPATVCWTSFDDATYFMRHCHTCVSSFWPTLIEHV